MNIPSGFQLQITTWENDGDCYKTQVFSGLTEADVKFYLSIARKFKSRNTGLHCERRPAENYGNGSITADEMIKMFNKAVEDNPDISENIKHMVENCKDEYQDDDEYRGEGYYQVLIELLGYTEEYGAGPFFCRVFDKATVYYFPEEILDITKEFESEK